jgi:hypothetical protein
MGKSDANSSDMQAYGLPHMHVETTMYLDSEEEYKHVRMVEQLKAYIVTTSTGVD